MVELKLEKVLSKSNIPYELIITDTPFRVGKRGTLVLQEIL